MADIQMPEDIVKPPSPEESAPAQASDGADQAPAAADAPVEVPKSEKPKSGSKSGAAKSEAPAAADAPVDPRQAKVRIVFAQFNLKDLKTSFIGGHIHEAREFGDELGDLLEMGAIEWLSE